MNSGFYSAYAGFASRMDALDLLANNLANANTHGFKSQHEFYRSFAASLQQPVSIVPATTVSGVLNQAINTFGMLGGSRLDLSQGNLETTGNDTDVALEGSGFLAVLTKNGVRYTRDGGFRLDGKRNLVTQQGDLVLSQQPNQRIQPIQVPVGKVDISPDGSVSVAGTLVARLRIEDFPAGTPLQQEGNNYFLAPESAAKPATGVTVRQGALETSNTDPVRGAISLIDLQRTAQLMEKALSIFHNEFNKTAVQELPHV